MYKIKYPHAIYTMLLAACCTGGLNSCRKYLDTTPTNILTNISFWQSQDDALAGVNACYATLRNNNLFGVSGMQKFEMVSPNSATAGVAEASGLANVANGTQNSSNTSIINGRWGADYEGIGRTNTVLRNVPGIKMDVALKGRILGEAWFLRALYYQDLVNYYGDVPLILDPPDMAQASLPRTPKAAVLKQVYADLDSAAANLPVSYSGTNVGRATKGAAWALKSRVYLYQGNWANAAQLAQQVRSLGTYNLYPDYRALFLPANKNNKEVIFDVQFSLPNYGNSYDVNAVKYQNCVPSLDLINAYLCKDGLPVTKSPLYNSAYPYNNRDPRLRKTMALPGFYFRNILVDANTFPLKAVWKKYSNYQDSVPAPSPDYTDATSFVNQIVLRYAEVLLNYAEARNEAVGPDATVYAALDSVRLRAGMPTVSGVNPGLSQVDMRNLIRLERRIELAGEGWYYDDVRRWKIAPIVLAQPGADASGVIRIQRAFQAGRDYLWPVPSVEIERNPRLLPQNPGYAN